MIVRFAYLFGIVVACSWPLNKPPIPQHSIESVQFNTSGCYGTCPQFGLLIQPDRKALYTAMRYNEREGNFEGTITSDAYAQLIALLERINFTTLKDEYNVNWTDAQTALLTIKYDKGKTKFVRDYGEQGTEGLRQVYKLLHDWRHQQKWIRSNQTVPDQLELDLPDIDMKKFTPPVVE